jgi:hypothetical protein
MLGFAKTFLLFNRVDSFEEICTKIDSITADKIQTISNELFDEKQLSTLLYPAN